VLGGINKQGFPEVLVGTELYDDAGVVRLSDNLALVTTVDFFTPVVDDPFEFGAIAVANSLSDIYAMGAVPASALNIVGFPEKSMPLGILREIINGGLAVAGEANLPIVGGHTIKSPEPFYGLSITGSINPKRIWTNSSAQAGDLIYLTKPLGTGVITTAAKNDKADIDTIENAIKIMKELNRESANAIASVFENESECRCAVTDITGYGLLGHLAEMLIGSKKSALIDFSNVIFLPGAVELARKDLFPGGSKSNLLSVEPNIIWQNGFENYEKLLLADAQTSGGLLISIGRTYADGLEAELKESDVNFALIGEITERKEWLIKVEKN